MRHTRSGAFARGAIALAMAAVVPSGAWEISGKVTSRPGVPLEGARVCELGSPSHCAATAANGTFSLSGTAAGLAREAPAFPPGLSLHERLWILSMPASGRASLEWFSTAGARLAGPLETELAAGDNTGEIPRAAATAGLCLMRVTAGGSESVWKIFAGASFVSSVRTPATVDPTSVAAAKTSADEVPVLTATKDGYRSRNYYASDPVKDTAAWILLAAVNDDTTYKAGVASYAASAIPPNVVAGRTEYWKCAHCYGGAKAAQLLGHSATGKGTITFNGIYAPADGNFDVTWSYFCGANDNNGDRDCGGRKDILTPSGCRPGIFVINGLEIPTPFQFQCFASSWNNVHYATFSLPLKKGSGNSIKMYSKTADAPDLDRIMVPDGRSY